MDHNIPTQSNNMSVLIAIMMTTKVLEFFGLNNSFYGIVYISLLQFINSLEECLHNKKDYTNHVTYIMLNIINQNIFICGVGCLIILSTVLCYYYYDDIYKYCYVKQDHIDIKYKTLTLYDINKTMDVATYMNKNPEFFEGYNEVKRSDTSILQSLMGNIYKTSDTSRWLSRINGTTIPVVGDTIRIVDKKYNVNGYIIWYDTQLSTVEYGLTKEDKTVHKVNFKYVKIMLDVKSPAMIEQYVEDISRSVNKEINESFLSGKLISCDGAYEYEMMTKVIGLLKDYDIHDMEKKFIDTFFHPQKKILWQYLKRIKLEPEYFYKYGQTPQMNLLLYGPPGTGKSSFAYRIAKSLGRHIVSIDLRLITKKNILYSLMEKPIIDGRCYSPAQIVYVFDEFDLTVKYLHALQVKKNNEEKMWKNRIEGYYNAWNNDSHKYSKHKKGHYSSDTSSHYTATEDEIDEDVSDDAYKKQVKQVEEKRKKREKLKQRKKNKKSKNDNLSYYMPEHLSLQDLLEILQGPVPVEQRIIIATTNDYDGIRNLCPALFRTGRLTPVCFDNPSKETITEISLYYYNKDIQNDIVLPEKITVPTCDIIELCLKSMTTESPYEFFVEKVKNIINV